MLFFFLDICSAVVILAPSVVSRHCCAEPAVILKGICLCVRFATTINNDHCENNWTLRNFGARNKM